MWPGVWRTRSRTSPNRISPPSASSMAGTDGGISKGAQSGAGWTSASRSSGCTAMSASVAAATAALSPKWSQWPWVEMISLRVQPRAASSSEIQASDGIAVSIAMASRERPSARTWTFVASGPTTRLIRSMAAGQTWSGASSSTNDGKRKPNSAPPVGRLRAQAEPPAESTRARTTNRPIPAPSARRRASSVR